MLLLALGGAIGWGGDSRVERSRVAWAEQDRIERATSSAVDAIAQGDAGALEVAFRAGAVIAPDRAGETVLQSIGNMTPEVACVLVEHGADLTLENGRALADAIGAGETELARCLVEHGVNVRAKGTGVCAVAPLYLVAGSCATPEDVELARRLLERGADPNGIEDGMAPLSEAVAARPEPSPSVRALVELLLAHGADVNFRDRQGFTPLGWVRSMDESDAKRELVAFLQSRGASRE